MWPEVEEKQKTNGGNLRCPNKLPAFVYFSVHQVSGPVGVFKASVGRVH